jgi:prepilin-type N-terminal cleavage/methylation domain-containing protein
MRAILANRLRRDEHGFTLIEMVFVCLILGIVMAGLTAVFVSGTHSQLRLDRRTQAQQTARVALNAIRDDVHGACAANVTSGGAVLTLAAVPSTGSTACGADSSYSKTTWCTAADSTGGWSLFRSEDGTACNSTSGTLEAQHLTTSTPFSTASTISVEQYQTVTVSIPVLVPGGTGGDEYTLGQALALGNGVYEHVGTTTACSVTDATVCTPGPCIYGAGTCYPPAIQ